MQRRRKRTRGQLAAASVSHATPKRSLRPLSARGSATRGSGVRTRRPSNPAHSHSHSSHSVSTSADRRKRRRIDDGQSDQRDHGSQRGQRDQSGQRAQSGQREQSGERDQGGQRVQRRQSGQSGQRVSLAPLSSMLLGLLAPALYLAKVSQPSSNSSPRNSSSLEQSSGSSSHSGLSRRSNRRSSESSEHDANSQNAVNSPHSASGRREGAANAASLPGDIPPRRRRPRRERRPPPPPRETRFTRRGSSPPPLSVLEPSAELSGLLPKKTPGGNKTSRQMTEVEVDREQSAAATELHKLGIAVPYAENGVLKRQSDIDFSTPFRQGRWQDGEVRLAVDLFKRGASYAQIAALLHRSFKSVNCKLVFVLDPKYARQAKKIKKQSVKPPWHERAVLALRSFPHQEGTIVDVREFVENTWSNLDTEKAHGANLPRWHSSVARAMSRCDKIVKTRRKKGKASIWKLVEDDAERRASIAAIAAEEEVAEPARGVDNTPEGIVRRMGVGPGKIVLGYTSRDGRGFIRFPEPVHT